MEAERRDRNLQVVCCRAGGETGTFQCRTGSSLKMDYLLPRQLWPPSAQVKYLYWPLTQRNLGEEEEEM